MRLEKKANLNEPGLLKVVKKKYFAHTLPALYEKSLVKEAQKILNDHSEFERVPSGNQFIMGLSRVLILTIYYQTIHHGAQKH